MWTISLLVLLLCAVLADCQSTCSQGVPPSGAIPSTWPTRSFTLVISSITVPTTTGGTKHGIAVNGSIPGPRLDVDANDWVSVTVINTLSTTTAVHWHGLMLYSTPHLDGVPGLTQCGIPAGGQMTYSFCAAPSGTFWYHGHIDNQYIEGLYGPLVIRSANQSALTAPSRYQHDWVWQTADFYNQEVLPTLLPWFMSPASGGQEPQPDSLVVSGAFSSTSHLYAASTDTAIIRLINSGSLCMFMFAIDGVALTVVELDGTEVAPYTVSSVMLNVAQRAVVIVSFADLRSRYPSLRAVYYRVTMMPDADLTTDPFYPPYEANFTQFNNWIGTLHLDAPISTSPPAYTPTSANAPTLPANTADQLETNMLDARPLSYGAVRSGVSVGSVPAATHSLSLEIVFQNDASGVNLGYINDVSYNMSSMTATTAMSSMMTDSMMPTLYAAYSSPASWSTATASASPVIVGDSMGNYNVPYGAVLDVTILNTDSGEHPFHLHGQPFWLIATSDYPAAEFQYEGAWLMRDTMSIPAMGWVKLRFIADNPGVWMLHCHIDWHMTAGLTIILNVGLERVNPGFVYLAPGAVSQCAASIQSALRSAQSTWAASASSSSGLSHSNKIAVGVAVGVGVPVLLLAVLCVVLSWRAADRKRVGGQGDSKHDTHTLRKSNQTDSDSTSVSHRTDDEVELGTSTA